MEVSKTIRCLQQCFLALCLSLLPSLSLGRDLCSAWMLEIDYALSLHISYVWGGEDLDGADCSGILWLTANRAGVPVMRTTSERMLKGAGGWGGKEIYALPDSRRCDLIGFTMRRERLLGHIGVILEKLLFAHASSSRGFVRQELKDNYINKLRIIKRPTWTTSYK